MTQRAAVPLGFSLYLITDRGQTGGRTLLETVEEALRGGVRTVQLREKELASRAYWELAGEMRRLTSRYGARLLVNDRVDIARAVQADGVHLPASGLPVAVAREIIGPGKLVAVSCHTWEGAVAAREEGADFITFGPVYFTPSKAAYGEPVGLARLNEIAASLDIPVFALGGITRARVPEVLGAGAAGIALVSALLAAADPREEAKALLSLLPGTPRIHP